MRIRSKRYIMEVRKYEHCPARLCLSPPLSLDGAGDAFLRDSEYVDGGGFSSRDEKDHR